MLLGKLISCVSLRQGSRGFLGSNAGCKSNRNQRQKWLVDVCLTKNLCLLFAVMDLRDETKACDTHSEMELLESQKEILLLQARG